jgi:hypothetical protein
MPSGSTDDQVLRVEPRNARLGPRTPITRWRPRVQVHRSRLTSRLPLIAVVLRATGGLAP